jgi:hypothetical protein
MSLKSPFSSYLRTNYAPTSQEKDAIEALCADPLRDIQRLDEEINKLQEEMARLLQRREELQTFVDDHRMLLSPIRQLSPEVLQRIFLECVTADLHPIYHAEYYPVMLAAQAPMLLGRVCSAWRRIGYGTAELWNVLHIAIPNPEKCEADRLLATLRLEALKDWLGRTGSLPLHISLFAAPPGMNNAWNSENVHDYDHIYRYAEALMEFTDRWGSLTLYVPPPLLRPWSLLADRTLPMLKGVRLFYASRSDQRFYDVDYTDYQVLGFLRQTPLESVTLSLFSMVHMPTFRKDALTYLDIQTGLTFSNGHLLANFFSEFTSLCTLRFMFASWGAFSIPPQVEYEGRDYGSNSDMVTLPCLENLNVSGFGDDHCCIVDLWRHLRVPKLQSMSFQFEAAASIVTSSDSHSLFARFMDISQCSTLAIYYYTSALDNSQSPELHHTALIPYIRACTRITDLTIRFGSFGVSPNAGEGLLKDLFLEGDIGLLPRLTRLTLHGHLPTLTTEFLENITQSRANSSLGNAQVPLEHLEIHLYTTIEDSLRSQFGDGYSHAGTKIVVQAPIAPKPWKNPIVRTSPFAGLPYGEYWTRGNVPTGTTW